MNGAPIGTHPNYYSTAPERNPRGPDADSAARREAVLGDITSKFPAAPRVQVSLRNSATPTTDFVSHVIFR